MLIALALMTWGGTPDNPWSYVRLEETGETGCPVQIEFKNGRIHTDQDVVQVFQLDGYVVPVRMVLGRGETPDELFITAPEGMVAIPEHLIVDEDGTERALICHAMF